MSTSSVRTAQILQFPAGGRKALAQGKPTTATDLEIQAAAAAVGDSWYHDAAVQDAKRLGER